MPPLSSDPSSGPLPLLYVDLRAAGTGCHRQVATKIERPAAPTGRIGETTREEGREKKASATAASTRGIASEWGSR